MPQLNVSDVELSVLLEMLDQQKSQLLVETRHTDTRSFRVDLQQRLAVVDSLLERAKALKKDAQSLSATA
jgi:hypothetical protein